MRQPCLALTLPSTHPGEESDKGVVVGGGCGVVRGRAVARSAVREPDTGGGLQENHIGELQ